MNDNEFLKSINETSVRWFGKEAIALSPYQKSRLLPYVYHTMKTSIPHSRQRNIQNLAARVRPTTDVPSCAGEGMMNGDREVTVPVSGE